MLSKWSILFLGIVIESHNPPLFSARILAIPEKLDGYSAEAMLSSEYFVPLMMNRQQGGTDQQNRMTIGSPNDTPNLQRSNLGMGGKNETMQLHE